MPQEEEKRRRPPEAHNIYVIPKVGPKFAPGYQGEPVDTARSESDPSPAEPGPTKSTSEVEPDAGNEKFVGRTKMQKILVKEDGMFEASQVVPPDDDGGRKLYNIARPDKDRGPAFAILPIRPDPASQFGTTFLINTDNLSLPNPWTAADWDALPNGFVHNVKDGLAPPGPGSATDARDDGPEEFRVLIGTRKGKVYYAEAVDGRAPIIKEIDLTREPEIWAQLREGTIVGTAWCVDQGKIVPLFNASSLILNKKQELGANSNLVEGERE